MSSDMTVSETTKLNVFDNIMQLINSYFVPKIA